jgi:uncharacterized tellurite resistance protein B-like protein
MSTQTPKLPVAMVDRVFSDINGWSHKGKFDLPSSKDAHKAELELALTVVLVDLACIDQNFEQSEYQIIVEGVHSMFGTNALQVQALVNQAMLILKDLRGTNRFGSLLKENLNENQRTAIMEIVDQLVGADGSEDGFETYIRNKISSVLGIEIANKNPAMPES